MKLFENASSKVKECCDFVEFLLQLVSSKIVEFPILVLFSWVIGHTVHQELSNWMIKVFQTVLVAKSVEAEVGVVSVENCVLVFVLLHFVNHSLDQSDALHWLVKVEA